MARDKASRALSDPLREVREIVSRYFTILTK